MWYKMTSLVIATGLFFTLGRSLKSPSNLKNFHRSAFRTFEKLNSNIVNSPRKAYVDPSILTDLLASSVQIVFRLGSGFLVNGYKLRLGDYKEGEYAYFNLFGKAPIETANRPKQATSQPIEIYEFEGCPFCRKVREAVSILDLDVVFYPCPKGGPNFRQKVIKEGGKSQFPYMKDPNTKVSLYESDDIIQYLFDTYSTSSVPSNLSKSFLTTLTCGLGLMPRLGRGSKFEEARKANKPLTLWAYEASPFCKVVRERLCELEIPHLYKSCARGSAKRSELMRRTGGTFQVPFLEDPNTGVSMFESAEIIKYLDKTYSFKSVAV